MPLVTRTGKGSKLSIAEMDGNLTYLDNKVPYKVYTALLTQSGTDAPVATILENTIGNIGFNYSDVGNYFVNSNNLFTIDKTYILFGGVYGGENWINIYGNSSVIELIGSNNDVLVNTPIEIRVYN